MASSLSAIFCNQLFGTRRIFSGKELCPKFCKFTHPAIGFLTRERTWIHLLYSRETCLWQSIDQDHNILATAGTFNELRQLGLRLAQ
jgi:hypothetical protein